MNNNDIFEEISKAYNDSVKSENSKVNEDFIISNITDNSFNGSMNYIPNSNPLYISTKKSKYQEFIDEKKKIERIEKLVELISNSGSNNFLNELDSAIELKISEIENQNWVSDFYSKEKENLKLIKSMLERFKGLNAFK